MAMIDWAGHRLHRQAVIADDGQWVGLLDEDGVPMLSMPPLVSLDAPETRNAPEEMRATVRVVSRSGLVHPTVSELIADRLGVLDAEGRLEPAANDTRMVAVERAGGKRSVYKVTHCVAEGGSDAPSTMEVHAMGVLDLLDAIPCWSVPLSITGTWHRLDRDWGQEWVRERDVQMLEMAAQADGFTVDGPADVVVHRLISESLAATYRGVGIAADEPIRALPLAADRPPSPRALVRPDDASIWATVAPVAATAGLTVSARMWWPGDDDPLGDLTTPTVLVEVS
ncbi:MAG: hypothetical protein Q4F65_05915 [Propionibacteriaceae bacterium]|nr:hypothetical protein [Propionibacteriaceae bacterium]